MVLDMQNVLEQLTAVLEARKQAGETEKSYVASLHAKGLDQILKKVAEESGETLLAAAWFPLVEHRTGAPTGVFLLRVPGNCVSPYPGLVAGTRLPLG